MPSPALAHALSLHPAVSSCYLKLCASVQPWNQDLQKLCKMCVTCRQFSTRSSFIFLMMFPVLNFSANVENLNLDNVSKCPNILTLHHSSGQDNCSFQNRTHEAWEGGAEAQLTFSLPSPLLPRAPFDQHLPPSRPHFSPSCLLRPVGSHPLLLLLLRTSISQAQCTPQSRRTFPPPPPPKCQWSMESSLCWGKSQKTVAAHYICEWSLLLFSFVGSEMLFQVFLIFTCVMVNKWNHH